jgi:hypothetical protein
MRFAHFAALLLLSLPSAASAQSVLTLRPSAPAQLGGFGAGVAAFGGNVLVGAPGTVVGPTFGAVYLMDAATGAVLRTFPNPQSSGRAEFGTTIATLGTKVIVGDFMGFDGVADNGVVYVFDGVSGALLQTILDPESSGDGIDFFGIAIATLGGDIVVGSPRQDAGNLDAGAVYVFDGGTGALVRTLVSPMPVFFGQFGISVATLGANILVGAPGEERAYLFDGTTGALLHVYAAPAGGQFGWSVAAFGDDVLVGARTDATAAPNGGAAYLVDSASGALLQTYLSPTPGADDLFGSTLAVLGNDVLVGEVLSTQAGAVEVFDGASGAPLRTLSNPTPANGDDFVSVAVVGNAVVIGAANDDVAAQDGGGAYVFCGGAVGCGPCETCGPLGSCVVAPNPTCRGTTAPGATRLRLRDGVRDGSDIVAWKGDLVTVERAELGVPTSRTAYTACLYDESTPTPSLLFRATAPAGGLCRGHACWRSAARSVDYSNPDRTPEGIRVVHLQTFPSQGRAFVRFVAKGSNLTGRPFPLPTPPLPTPLSFQLEAKDGTCWSAGFSGANVVENGGGRFVSPSD